MDPQTFLVFFALFLLIVYLLLRRKRRKPQAPPVQRVIRQPRRTVDRAEGTRPGNESTGPDAKEQDSADGPLVVPPPGMHKPLSRGDIEAETLWRLEHTIREMQDIGGNQMVRVDFNMEPRELANMLASNPFYAARILKTVNSAAIGLRTRIDSLQRAITYLGYNQVKNIVFQHMLNEGLAGQRESLSDNFDLLRFWMHSHAVSICADHLLRNALGKPQLVGVVTTAALLHDVGWVVFDRYDREKAGRLYDMLGGDSVDGEPMAVEENLFGFNHLVAGEMLAEKWEIPRAVCEMVSLHHCGAFGLGSEVGSEPALGACVIAIAEQLSARMGYGNPFAEPYGVMADLSPVLGKAAVDLDRAPAQLRQEVEKMMKFIEEFNRD